MMGLSVIATIIIPADAMRNALQLRHLKL
jgi:hypothetical protein